MSIVHYAEQHPYQLAGAIFGIGIIVVLVVTHKSSAPPPQSMQFDGGYNASTIAANASIQNASTAAQAHSFDTSAALQGVIDGHATAVALAHDQTGLALALGGYAEQVDIAKIQGMNATAMGLATTAGNVDLGLATTHAGEAVQLANIAAGVSADSGATAFKMAQVAADTSRFNSMAGADLSKFVTQSGNDAALAGAAIAGNNAQQLATITGAIDIAKTNIGAGVTMAQIGAGVQTAQFSADVAMHGQDASLASSRAGFDSANYIANQHAQTDIHGEDTKYLADIQHTNTDFMGRVHANDLSYLLQKQQQDAKVPA